MRLGTILSALESQRWGPHDAPGRPEPAPAPPMSDDSASALAARSLDEVPTPGWTQLETVFEALGRVLVVLDERFSVLRVSQTLDRLGCEGASEAVLGEPVERLLGGGLFGEGEILRVALEQGRREEGRRAVLHCGDHLRLVSLTAAFLPPHVRGDCDPRARYLLVLRPAEEDDLILQSATASHGLVTRSAAMLRILHLIESLSRSDATVLITGDSGTGKEVVARALHAHSPRAPGAFVAVNCAALPPDLLESELFGHVRGAFTGAVRDRVGRFEAAAGGTVLLDEIGDLAPHLQVKLLRVLQELRFERVGESVSRPMTARVIAATNVDLRQAIAEGRFREDLYYRLRVVPIHLPALRERPEDVAPIAQHMLARIGRREGRALRLSPDTLRRLERYAWPGNVRELENALEYAHAVCQGQTIQLEDLPPEIRGVTEEVPGPAVVAAGNPPEADAVRIRAALEATHWNRRAAAARLGVSRSTLWRRMRELGIG